MKLRLINFGNHQMPGSLESALRIANETRYKIERYFAMKDNFDQIVHFDNGIFSFSICSASFLAWKKEQENKCPIGGVK